MTNEDFRHQTVEIAMQRQINLVEDFQQRIDDATANDGTVNEEQYDNQEQTFKAGILSEVTLLTQQLKAAQAGLECLQRIQYNNRSDYAQAELGAIVRTDRMTFFVAIPTEEFKVNGEPVCGISVDSPIYKSMKGRKKGRHFSYGGSDYRIHDIF